MRQVEGTFFQESDCGPHASAGVALKPDLEIGDLNTGTQADIDIHKASDEST